MVKKKGHSKRTTLKDKYRVQRRVTETHRKRRKQDKKDIASGKVIHKPKDPGIPNSWPFKQDLLKDIARTRERAQEQIVLKKQQRQKELLALHEHQTSGGTARTITELMEQAQSDNTAFTQKQDTLDHDNDKNNGDSTEISTSNTKKKKSASGEVNDNSGQQSRRAYLRELKKVIDQSDVILQVLDARDPISTRMHQQQEDSILSYVDKRMVLVLNKIDLVPKQVVSAWLTYLRRSHPTIAIKACGGSTFGTSSGKMDDTAATTSSTPLGMDGLLQLLKNYARTGGTGGPGSKKHKSTIVVGIVGYPNTGKSSIINALKRCRAVGVSARPGFTTCLQEVALDTNVRLLDSPGVVFDDKSTMLANCVDTESIPDPITPIIALLNRADHKSLLLTYNIPTFTPPTNVDMFLALVAKSHGRVLKGGIPDKKAAARAVLRDWNSGKIPYYTLPPTSDGTKTSIVNNDAVIVNGFGPAFDISKYDDEVLQTLNDTCEMDCIQLDSTIPQLNKDNNDDDDDDDDDDHAMNIFDANEDDEDENVDGEEEVDGDEMEEEDSEDDDDDNYDFNEMLK
jgi:nuclear GTP-binding protein